MSGFGWKLHGDGRHLEPGEVVRPDERLTWVRTMGLGAQHVVSMIGACFVAPVLMGLDPSLGLMASGVATLLFLVITRGRVPSYLGSSLSFVGVAAVIGSQGGGPAEITGARLVVGLALAAVGVIEWPVAAVIGVGMAIARRTAAQARAERRPATRSVAIGPRTAGTKG